MNSFYKFNIYENKRKQPFSILPFTLDYEGNSIINSLIKQGPRLNNLGGSLPALLLSYPLLDFHRGIAIFHRTSSLNQLTGIKQPSAVSAFPA